MYGNCCNIFLRNLAQTKVTGWLYLSVYLKLVHVWTNNTSARIRQDIFLSFYRHSPYRFYGLTIYVVITIVKKLDIHIYGIWFQINCSKSGSHDATADSGPQHYQLDPLTDFQYDEICDVTITSTLVSDVDANDPPDVMESDVLFSFGTEVNSPIVINEVDADTAGSDTLEFIELYVDGKLVGKAELIRTADVTAPSLTGTLRSSRIKTVLPCKSKSAIFNTDMFVPFYLLINASSDLYFYY